MSGTIILPSNDRLDTSRVTAPDGSIRHRENMVISGTVFPQIANVVNSQPASTDYGLPVWQVGLHPDASTAAHQVTQNTHLSNLRTDVQSVQTATQAVQTAILGTPAVKFASPQQVTFSGQQPVHGTVVVSSMPAVNVTSGTAAYITNPAVPVVGTVNISGVPTVSIQGSIGLADYARYSEQQTQTTRLNTIDSDIIAIRDAVLGTPAVKFPSAQSVSISNTPSVTFSGQQPVHGTVVISSMPAVNVSSGTQAYVTNDFLNTHLKNVGFAGTPIIVNVSNTPSVTFSGQQPVHGTVVVSSMPAINVTAGTAAYITNPAVPVVGTVAISGVPAVSLSGVGLVTAHQGTPAGDNNTWPVRVTNTPSVSISNTPSVTFAGQQPVHGTVAIHGVPSVAFSGVPTVTANQGTPAGDNNTWPVRITNTPGVSIGNTPAVTFSGQQPIHGTVVISASALPSGASTLVEQQTQTTTLQLIDDIIHTFNAALGKVAAIGGQVDDQSITVGTEGNVVPIRVTPLRAIHSSLRREDGIEVGTAGTPLRFDPTGTTTQPVSNTVLSVVGGGAEATAQRVTIANDSTGVLSVDDNGGSLTVDFQGQQPVHGTVVVNNTVTTSVSNSPSVTFVSAQPISTVAGTVAVNVRNHSITHKSARLDATVGNTTVVSGIANRRLKVYGVNMQSERNGTIHFVWMNQTHPLSGTQIYTDGAGYTHSVTPPAFLFAPEPGTPIIAHVGTLLNVGGARGWVSYWDDDVN